MGTGVIWKRFNTKYSTSHKTTVTW